jgi:hypothetical protein
LAERKKRGLFGNIESLRFLFIMLWRTITHPSAKSGASRFDDHPFDYLTIGASLKQAKVKDRR